MLNSNQPTNQPTS